MAENILTYFHEERAIVILYCRVTGQQSLKEGHAEGVYF